MTFTLRAQPAGFFVGFVVRHYTTQKSCDIPSGEVVEATNDCEGSAVARLTKLYSYINFQATRPRDPLPADKIESDFAAIRKGVNDLDVELKDVRRSDGALVNGIVTQDSLAPGLLDKLKSPLDAAVQAARSAGAGNAALAQQAAQDADQSRIDAATAAQNAEQAANSVTANVPGALKDLNDAKTAAVQATRDVSSAVTDAENAASNAKGSEDLADKYAELASLWAEWCGNANSPGDATIPPNKLAWMGVTGDHWSARYWANRASNAFGRLSELYLGVHADHAAATASSSQVPPAVGAVYYNSTSNQPYVWSGSGWTPFWQPQKALTTSLYYKVTAAQSEFVLSTSDLLSNSYTLDKTDTEPLDVYVNGVRLFPATGTPPVGDYAVDATNNKVVIAQSLAIGSVVTIDVLTPRDKFAIGSVNFHSLLSLDLDPVTKAPGLIDGVKTQFVLTRTDGKAVTASGAVEVFVSVDGVIQQPGVDYNVVGARITFTQPPAADSVVWALWMEPSASGGSGKGVNPPAPPDDLHINRLGWSPGAGVQWDDDRGDMHSVANAAARLALKDPEQLIPGSMVYERNTHDIWVYTPVAAPGSGPAAVGGSGTTTGGGAATHTDINLAPGADFQTAIRALSIGDTVFVGGKYYRLARANAMREAEFPGGLSYNSGIFLGTWTEVPGPSWNGYAAPTTPGMAQPTTGASSAPTAAGDPKLTTNWTMALKGHPTDNILRALEYDPSRPNSMAWEDNRDEMETVNAEADLYNPAVLPPSHLAVGKLVYVRATGQLWECLVDGTTGTITNSLADWKPLGGAGVTFVGRIGNLPDPTVKTVPDGSLFMVNMDLTGKPYHRLYVFDAQGVNAAGVVGIYRPCAAKDFIKALKADPDQGLDAEPGDLQATLENGHKELKAYDTAGAWQTVYSEDLVKQWIAAGNLFQGTAQDKGHGTVGAVDLDKLPAQSALGITDAGHYYIYVGLAGKVIVANDVGGGPSNIDGAKLNVGDWILVANTGTAAAPVMRYTHVPGDLLAKSRGDNLYGLNNWTAGAYEQGSLVVYNGDVYKAGTAVLPTSPAPGATVTAPATNPWVKVNISGGVKTVATDSALPAGAANGAVYLVLSSARAGGKQALYSWDAGASAWNPLGGGGIPLALGGGKKIVNVGVPIGTVIDFAGKTLPAGYLLCNGATFDQLVYPKLFTALGGNTLPDLRNQFVRGANTMADVSFVKHDATTGMPKTHFTGVTNSTGSHTHTTDSQGRHDHGFTDGDQPVCTSLGGHDLSPAGGGNPEGYRHFRADGAHTHTAQSAGAHTHTVEIQSGGDSETAPMHVILAKIIKADDINQVAI